VFFTNAGLGKLNAWLNGTWLGIERHSSSGSHNGLRAVAIGGEDDIMAVVGGEDSCGDATCDLACDYCLLFYVCQQLLLTT
jgi:hypothetical protein